MIVPFLLFLTSLGGVVAAVLLPGLSDLILIAGPCAIASLVLLGLAYRRRDAGTDRVPKNWVVVDGSNVMHWKDDTPQIATLSDVLNHLEARGFVVRIVFDANAGYKLSDRYQHDGALARMFHLPENQVLVVPKGMPADPVILRTARDLGVRVVSNDRYRDWEEIHPEVRTPGHLIRGGYRDGQLWLDVG